MQYIFSTSKLSYLHILYTSQTFLDFFTLPIMAIDVLSNSSNLMYLL